MKPGPAHSNPLLLISLGLMIGIFTGAGMVYYFFQRIGSHHLHNRFIKTEATSPVKSPESPSAEYRIEQRFMQAGGAEDNQILGMKEMIIPNEQSVQANQVLMQLDSLIGKTREQQMNKNSILIIFYNASYEQPGYIMSPRQISIFGISEPELASIRLIEDSFYLEYMDYYFELRVHPDFSPLLPVWDEQAIADIQKEWN